MEAVPLLHLRHRLLVPELDRVLRRVDVQRPAPAAAALAAQVDAVAAAGGCKYFLHHIKNIYVNRCRTSAVGLGGGQADHHVGHGVRVPCGHAR